MIVTRYDEYLLTKWKQWHYEKRGRNRQWDPDILITYIISLLTCLFLAITPEYGSVVCLVSVYVHQLFIVFAIHHFDGRREKRAQKRPRPPLHTELLFPRFI